MQACNTALDCPLPRNSSQLHVSDVELLAGLEGFDTDLSKARAVEAAIGVPVLQHKNKKPAGGCKEILQRFKCESHEVVVVGDRLLTDIVFGNINGMLTVHVRPA